MQIFSLVDKKDWRDAQRVTSFMFKVLSKQWNFGLGASDKVCWKSRPSWHKLWLMISSPMVCPSSMNGYFLIKAQRKSVSSSIGSSWGYNIRIFQYEHI